MAVANYFLVCLRPNPIRYLPRVRISFSQNLQDRLLGLETQEKRLAAITHHRNWLQRWVDSSVSLTHTPLAVVYTDQTVHK